MLPGYVPKEAPDDSMLNHVCFGKAVNVSRSRLNYPTRFAGEPLHLTSSTCSQQSMYQALLERTRGKLL